MRCAARSDAGATPLLYGGPSMHPLLRQHDLLEVAPCGAAAVRPGDVIAFRATGGESIVVHRVVAIGGAGLITRGDNNGWVDDAPVREGQLVGRVCAVRRGAGSFAVAGGRRGLLKARLSRLRRAWRGRVGRFVRPPYRLVRGFSKRLGLPGRLAEGMIARSWLPARLRPRVVTFSSGGVSVTRLIVAGRAVGYVDPGSGRWRVHPLLGVFSWKC